MHGNSTRVSSSQNAIHPRLRDTVRRHLAHPWRAPLRSSTVELALRLKSYPNLVLDLGCGTGESTHEIAKLHPEATVIGIDQSAHRLRRLAGELGFSEPAQVQLIREDAYALLVALSQLQVAVSKCYLLYPNPWPKSEHLKRRWHGHPAFAALLQVSARLELRSNWPLYVDEFAAALDVAGYPHVQRRPLTEPLGLTPFERKYAASGHALFQLQYQLISETCK